jgi:hypothetical protein
MERKQVISSPDEFGSLSQATAHIDAVRERMGSLDALELTEALDRFEGAYREFPELAPERPRSSFSSIVTSFLDQTLREPLSALQRGERLEVPEAAELSALLSRFRELCWDDIEPIVSAPGQQGRADMILQIISAVLDRAPFSDAESATGLGNLLTRLLAVPPPEIDGGKLAGLVRSARRRLNYPPPGRHRPGCKEVLLALAERLRAPAPPAAIKPHSGASCWPSGRRTFDEFLLQWPCEIELPADLDDAGFIDEAYDAILLCGPGVGEREQYLRLLRNGAVSREWIIEDLLASEELHSLERRLRVAFGGRAITEPGSPEREDMPAVTWPSRSAG